MPPKPVSAAMIKVPFPDPATLDPSPWLYTDWVVRAQRVAEYGQPSLGAVPALNPDLNPTPPPPGYPTLPFTLGCGERDATDSAK